MGLLPTIVPVHADSPTTTSVLETRLPGIPNFVASKGPLPLGTSYAEVQWSTSDNYSVVTDSTANPGFCVNAGNTPCFSLQLTESNYCNGSPCGGYQWIFYVEHGQDIIGCVTSNQLCGSGNECSWGSSYPADDFSADTFYISWGSATSYAMGVYNPTQGYSWCSNFATGSLSGIVAWEVSTGVGYISSLNNGQNGGSCAIWSRSPTNEVWSVSGYAPSGVTMGSPNTTPATCTAAPLVTYNGGNAIWVVSGSTHGSTGEAGNLFVWSWTNNSAQNFQYTVQN